MSYFRAVIKFVLNICLVFLVVYYVIFNCPLEKGWFLTDKTNLSSVIEKVIFFYVFSIN